MICSCQTRAVLLLFATSGLGCKLIKGLYKRFLGRVKILQGMGCRLQKSSLEAMLIYSDI